MATAARGGKARPAHLKLANGRTSTTDSGGRKVDPPPPFVRLPPEAPEWLGEYAREEWDRVVPELNRLNLLKPVDGAALASYCETVEVFIRATKLVHAGELVIENRSVKKDGTETVWYTANPSVAVQRNAQAAIRAWCAEFGLTPAAESKVSGRDGGSNGDENPFGEARTS